MNARRNVVPRLIGLLLLLGGGAGFGLGEPGAEAAALPLADGARAATGSSASTLDGALDLVTRGEALFQAELQEEQGLGPLFNARSCVTCHSSPVAGGTAPDGLGVVLRVGQLADGEFDPLIGRGGPIARGNALPEAASTCRSGPGIPAGANLTSVRISPALYGLGLVDAIPDEVIRAGAVPRGDGVHGRPNPVRDADGRERVGRFGWKADTPTLEHFIGEAFRNEHGITNPFAPADLVAGCGEPDALEDDGTLVAAVTAFVASLPPPASTRVDPDPVGLARFREAGCAACHTPSLRAGDRDVPLYSDLLMHDLGPILDDGVVQGDADGHDWRTTPLWGLGSRTRFLHDGRARTVQAAILAHGGEAERSIQRFRALSSEERAALLAFLSSL